MTTYLVDGQNVTAEECRRIFAQEKLGGRQKQVLELVEGDVVLDIGCYSGFFISELLRRYPNKAAIGVDYFEDNIRIAHLLRPNLRDQFRQMSAYEIQFEDKSVDCVTIQEVLEHLEGAAQAIKEINRVLRGGGVVIATVPNPYFWRNLLGLCRFEIRNSLRRLLGRPAHLSSEIFFENIEWNRHIFAWTPQTLLTLFAVNGFEYVVHDYERAVAGIFERLFLRAFPFFGPTQILKVRKIADASKTLV